MKRGGAIGNLGRAPVPEWEEVARAAWPGRLPATVASAAGRIHLVVVVASLFVLSVFGAQLIRIQGFDAHAVAEEARSKRAGTQVIPAMRGRLVSRPAHIRYTGLTLDGDRLTRVARGFHARVVQHEFDHLDGMLYPQRMDDLTRLIFESEARHHLNRDGAP